MDNNKKSALLNATKKLKTARNSKPTGQGDGITKKINAQNPADTNLANKIKDAVAKVDRD